MATTFNVISLGVQTLIDPTEGNTTAENASSLVGLTFGDVRDPLWENVQSFSPGTNSYGRGTNDAYDMNNNAASENFRINGGPNQVFDGTAIYNATITYTDGTTAQITAVIFQDTNGNTYLAPDAMGLGLPTHPLLASRQHRMMIRSRIAARMFGQAEVLVPAHKLCGLEGFDVVDNLGFVTYWHFMCDTHEVVFANGAPAETLYLGAEARKSLLPEALNEVLKLFPNLASHPLTPARLFAKGAGIERFTQRLAKNSKKPVEQLI